MTAPLIVKRVRAIPKPTRVKAWVMRVRYGHSKGMSWRQAVRSYGRLVTVVQGEDTETVGFACPHCGRMAERGEWLMVARVREADASPETGDIAPG